MIRYDKGVLTFSFTVPRWLNWLWRVDPRTMAHGESSRSWRKGPFEVVNHQRRSPTAADGDVIPWWRNE